MKLREKQRDGSRTRRHHDPAQTPHRRLLARALLAPETQRRLAALAQRLDPVLLLQQVETLLEALWRHAVFLMPGGAVTTEPRAQSALVTFQRTARAVPIGGDLDDAQPGGYGACPIRRLQRAAPRVGMADGGTREGVLRVVCQGQTVREFVGTLLPRGILLGKRLDNPRGHVTELLGPESSGKTTLLYAALAAAQARGGLAALVDAEESADAEALAACGVAVGDLLIARPASAPDALLMLTILARCRALDALAGLTSTVALGWPGAHHAW